MSHTGVCPPPGDRRAWPPGTTARPISPQSRSKASAAARAAGPRISTPVSRHGAPVPAPGPLLADAEAADEGHLVRPPPPACGGRAASTPEGVAEGQGRRVERPHLHARFLHGLPVAPGRGPATQPVVDDQHGHALARLGDQRLAERAAHAVVADHVVLEVDEAARRRRWPRARRRRSRSLELEADLVPGQRGRACRPLDLIPREECPAQAGSGAPPLGTGRRAWLGLGSRLGHGRPTRGESDAIKGRG